MTPFIKFNNGDLRFDIQKIQSFDAPITVAKAFDNNLDYPFAIDVEDSSYFYANIEERNEDFEKLNSIMPQFSFVESPKKHLKNKIMNYAEQLEQLWEQMRIDIANKVRKVGTESEVGALTIQINLNDFECEVDLGGSGGVLTEVGENDIFDNDGYSYAFGVLDYEQLAELTDYINGL